jgi:probable rRNA maturation factor
VLRQAAAAGHSPRQEFLYLLAHGILHLVGYDDQTQAGYETMVRKQEAILAATEERVGGL